MKISVCILNWNTGNVLERTLESLNDDLVGLDHEIVIVDQGSVDNSIELVQYFKNHWNTDGEIRLIANEKNIGISRGKNQCIEAAEGEYILLIDGDVLPVPNSIHLMIEWLVDNPYHHAIGMYPNKWTNQENKPPQIFYEPVCYSLYEPKEHNGACLFYGMYRRKIFDDGLRCCVEGALGEPGYGWEDHDFFYEMKRRGIRQFVAHINNPQGHYYHRINSSLKTKDCLSDQHYRENYKRRKDVYDERKNATRQSNT